MDTDINLQNEHCRTGPLISLVIACYNEKNVIEESVLRIRSIMLRSRYPYEIIFIDDGSTDGTQEIIKKLVEAKENERVYFHKKNWGRGRTVSEGIRAARGGIVGFVDIDLEIDALYIPALALEIEKGANIATGRRIYRLKLNSIHRQLMSKIYVGLVRFLFDVPLRDTESGCKFFNREMIIPVLDEIKDNHWFWDTEIMVRSYFKGMAIKELPCVYTRRPETGTTVKLIADVIYYIKKLSAFYKEMKCVYRAGAKGKHE